MSTESNQAERRILRRADVEARCGFKRAHLYKLVRDGKFPRPLPIGIRAVGRDSVDIDQWIADQVQRPSRGSYGALALTAASAAIISRRIARSLACGERRLNRPLSDAQIRAFQERMERLGRPNIGAILDLQRALGLREMEAIRAGQADALRRLHRELVQSGCARVFDGTKNGRPRWHADVWVPCYEHVHRRGGHSSFCGVVGR